MNEVYLSIGSNLKDKVRNIYQCQILIEERIGKIVDMSFIYETEPWGFESKHRFLNKVVKVKTNLSASIILNNIHYIENKLGRTRNKSGYSNRTIDIDILLFNEEIINTSNLIIPHRNIENRKFELFPLCQIAGYKIHPVLKLSFNQLLNNCTDKGEVKLFTAY